MSESLAGPFRMEEANSPLKMAEPTIRILASDGTTVLAMSLQGSAPVQRRMRAVADQVVDALNGGEVDSGAALASATLLHALGEIVSDDVTNVKTAKEIARGALGYGS